MESVVIRRQDQSGRRRHPVSLGFRKLYQAYDHRYLAILFPVLAMIIFLAGGLQVRAAAKEEGDLFIDGYSQQLFTYEDGLLSTSSTAIAQTEDGFIWLGGYGGLVRYDGNKFVPFAEKGLTNITDLMSGRDNTLWIASADSGLMRYHGGEFEHIHAGSFFEGVAVQCLTQSDDGRIWFGTTDGIGRVSSDGTVDKVEIAELSGQFILHLVWTENDRVICVTRDGKLFVWDGTECSEPSVLKEEEGVRCVRYDPRDKVFYIGTYGEEIICCDREFKRLKTIEAPGMEVINDIRCRENGDLWFCSDTGIAVYADGQLRIQQLMMNNSVDKMMTDMEGNDWFVSSRQGILEVCRGSFDNISQSAGLESLVVNALAKIGNRLYVGHDDGLLILNMDTRKQVVDPAFDRLSHVRVRCLYVDDDENLWIATKAEGLLCFTAQGEWKSWTMETHPVLRSDNFRCILAGEDGLIAGTDSGAYRIHEDGSVDNVLNHPEDLEVRVLCAAEMNGVLYLGTDGYGLYVVEKGEVREVVGADNGLTSNVIMKFCRGSRKGSLWMVTGNSIMYRDADGTFTLLDKFPASNKLDFVLDGEGTALVLTGGGIYRTTEESLLQGDISWMRLFRHADGQPFEVTANSNQYLENHILYYCGSGGVADLRYAEDMDEDEELNLDIDSLRADGSLRNVPGDKKVDLDAETRRIDIDAHVITFCRKNPYVFYYLENFEEEMTVLQLSDLQTVSYTNLPGGDYRFHFGICDPLTREVRKEIVLDIHKNQIWYKVRSVQIAMILLLAALMSLTAMTVYHTRTRNMNQKLRQEYELKENIRLKEIAYKDYLTGLYNRNYLNEWQMQVLPDIKDHITFISLDCNDLKWINDHHGHNAGDQLLKEFADIIRMFFSGKENVIFRTGGDEFLILSSEASPEEAKTRLQEMSEEAAKHEICGRKISFAYGIGEQWKETFDFEAGLYQSDMELLEAKDSYHNRSHGSIS